MFEEKVTSKLKISEKESLDKEFQTFLANEKTSAMEINILAKPQGVTLSVESKNFLYDLIIDKNGKLYYLINGKQVDNFPKGKASNLLNDFYQKNKSIIMEYLKNPSNDNWWNLKNITKKISYDAIEKKAIKPTQDLIKKSLNKVKLGDVAEDIDILSDGKVIFWVNLANLGEAVSKASGLDYSRASGKSTMFSISLQGTQE